MESINDQAARWTVRAVAGPLSQDEERELEAWLDANPRHRGAYVRARAQWADLNRLAALQGSARRVGDSPRREEMAAAGLIVEKLEDSLGLTRRQLLAAGLATFTIAGGGVAYLHFRVDATRYVSGIGEIRRISLEDGSTMLLNTATEAIVEFGTRQRVVRLIRGEALFEVAHDKARPFVVMANDTRVRAVGTAFAVRLESSRINLTVTEGVVELANSATRPSADSSPASGLQIMRISATERVDIVESSVRDIRRITPAEAERSLAWRDGLVSFDGESMQSAVAEINRHNRRQIVIDDPTLAAKPIVGVFRANDVEGFSMAAAAVLKAKAIQDGQYIHLKPDLTQGGN